MGSTVMKDHVNQMKSGDQSENKSRESKETAWLRKATKMPATAATLFKLSSLSCITY